MDEEERYDQVCEPKFDLILSKLDNLNKRLVEDNGSKSVQTRISENAIWCSVIKWFTITVTGAFLVGIIATLFFLIRYMIVK